MESNGSKGGSYYESAGGSSGGGSINIFCRNSFTRGTIEALGGEPANDTATNATHGAKGGNGTISIGSIKGKDYVSLVTEIKLEKQEVNLIKTLNNEEIKGKNGEETGDIQEYSASILNENGLKDKKWISSNSSVATVDENGKIVATGPGEVDIICKAKNIEGVELENTIKVKVKEKLYLYFYGNEFTSVTGGYIKTPRTGRTYSASFNTNNIWIDCYASYGGGGVCTVNKINIQGFSALKAYVNHTSYATGDAGGPQISIATTNKWGPNAYPETQKRSVETGMSTGYKTLEINNTQTNFDGEYYIFNGMNQAKGYTYSIWLEK